VRVAWLIKRRGEPQDVLCEPEDDMYYHALAATDIDARPSVDAARRTAELRRRKLLVAFDGSTESRCALDYAIEQARAAAAMIHAVNVQEAPVDDGLAYRTHKHAGEKVLQGAIAQLEANGIAHSADVAFGAVAECIVRSAAVERCDHIVVGTRDRLAIASFFSPSVTSQVVRLSMVPVTVVKQRVLATTHAPRWTVTAAWRPRT
jgi:nucleotide-binding universal stress UspA family protein